MRQTHYGRLGVPSTATQVEIRAAYQRQMDRVHGGELPASLEPEIERAYATLGNSSRRLSYDADVAAQSVMPMSRLTSSPPATLLAGMAVGAALSVAVVLAMSPLGRALWAPSTTPNTANSSQIAAALPPVVTAPEATAAAQPVPVEAAASAAPSTSPAAADDQAPAPAPSAPPAVAAAPPVSVARTVAAAPAAAAPVYTYRQSPVYYSGYYSDNAYSSDGTYAASTEPDQATASADTQAAPTVEAPPVVVSSGRTAPALLSAPFGASHYALRFPGSYCSDASGGQIFVAAGAPLPQGVTC